MLAVHIDFLFLLMSNTVAPPLLEGSGGSGSFQNDSPGPTTGQINVIASCDEMFAEKKIPGRTICGSQAGWWKTPLNEFVLL